MDEDFDLLGLSRNQSPTHIPGGYRHNAYDPWEGWSGTPISEGEAADRDVELRNVFGFEDANNPKPTKKHRPFGGLNAQALKNIHDTIWDLNQTNNTVTSGGDNAGGGNVSTGNKMSITDKINNKWTPTNLSFTPRFNKLWKVYNLIKDKPGVQNDPRYHKIVKKLSRKMPRLLKHLNKSIEKSSQQRQETAKILGGKANVSLDAEIAARGKEEVKQFVFNPHVTPESTEEAKSSKKVISSQSGVTQDFRDTEANTSASNWAINLRAERERQNSKEEKKKAKEGVPKMTGRNLNNKKAPIGSSLGTDISAALKNKKW